MDVLVSTTLGGSERLGRHARKYFRIFVALSPNLYHAELFAVHSAVCSALPTPLVFSCGPSVWRVSGLVVSCSFCPSTEDRWDSDRRNPTGKQSRLKEFPHQTRARKSKFGEEIKKRGTTIVTGVDGGAPFVPDGSAMRGVPRFIYHFQAPGTSSACRGLQSLFLIRRWEDLRFSRSWCPKEEASLSTCLSVDLKPFLPSLPSHKELPRHSIRLAEMKVTIDWGRMNVKVYFYVYG